ncbi:MAG: carbamoyl-phosphate synthase large subunit, partial [Deltaproteobacteria bacterium]|nr:carbamoyl-phosphate synthase large subunit [Deltaproteobacteria bacterium]
MPKRTDLKRIMVIGSGPIVIGQACEFDYSGTQAVKALKEEGYEVVLVNSNPATIMTDPGLADKTYVEPLSLEHVEAIIAKERPDAILPTLGGQTGLNLSLSLAERGVLQKYGIELLGADAEVIAKAESRELFRSVINGIGMKMPASAIVRNLDEVRRLGGDVTFPLILRPAFTLGGAGGGVAYNAEDLESMAAQGLAASMRSELLVEQSVLGWKELEIEIIRDAKDNCIIVCSIENFDPMGVHTGDSIAIAPAMSLSQADLERLFAASREIIRAIGMKGGGANIQFAQHPTTGELVVIEMNPRVSRSSALASKATGFPIAAVSARLAVGYTLDELANTAQAGRGRKTLTEYDPNIDYIVVKAPRFTFEKFPGAKDELTTAMKSVGEVMALGKSFKEAFQKGLRAMEIGAFGLGVDFRAALPEREEILAKLRIPNSRRVFYLRWAVRAGLSDEEIYAASAIDYWFLREVRELVELEDKLRDFALGNSMDPCNPELKPLLQAAKEAGFSDRQLAEMWKQPESAVRRLCRSLDLRPDYRAVVPATGSGAKVHPYFYSSNKQGLAALPDQFQPTNQKKIIILGGGPNRIGQGIEFDYCCTHAAYALQEMGVESIMVNSNPETVSTDYDTSDRLYFEPLTFEDVMNIVEYEKPDGVIVQFGGQTPLNLAVPLMRAGVPIVGTTPDAIDRAEDRERFQALLEKLRLRQPANDTAMTLAEARDAAARIGYPVVVRPSYVLGGRSMVVAYDDEQLADYFAQTLGDARPEHPILIDKFLENATEVDVDA